MAKRTAAQTAEIIRATPRISVESLDVLYQIRGQLIEEREQIIPTWKEIAQHCNPLLADWNFESEIQTTLPDMKVVYDNTAMKASGRLADGIQGYSFSRSSAWNRLATEDESLMDRTDVSSYLQRSEIGLYNQWAKSSFYDEGRSFIRIGADFGTAIMFRTNNVVRGIPQYQVLHLKRCCIMEDENGEVDTLFRDLWLTPFDAVAMFGYEALPVIIQDAYRNNDTTRKMFTQFIFPLDKFDLDIDARSTKGMPFYSVYVADCDHRKAIREGGYEVKPFFVWRWSRNPDGSVWGIDCPGMLEISNVMMLSGMRKDYHRMIQLRARPPLKATEQLQGRLNLTPSGVTWMRAGEDYGAGMLIGDTKGILEDMSLLQKGVNESYHTELFLVLTQNIQRTKTATEVEGLRGEQAAMLTAFFGRLGAEFLEPVTEDLFQLEIDAGRAPPAPRVLGGQRIKIDLVSPLAQLQKRYLLLDNTRQALNEIFTLAQIDKTALDPVNLEAYVRSIGKYYNIDRNVLRDVYEVQKIRAARQKQQEAMLKAQMQMKAAELQSKVYGATSKAPEAGSPAESMAEAV